MIIQNYAIQLGGPDLNQVSYQWQLDNSGPVLPYLKWMWVCGKALDGANVYASEASAFLQDDSGAGTPLVNIAADPGATGFLNGTFIACSSAQEWRGDVNLQPGLLYAFSCEMGFFGSVPPPGSISLYYLQWAIEWR